jgi:long-chain acyl-CoA synthetase
MPSLDYKSPLWQMVFNDLTEIGKNQGLLPYEQVKNIAMIKEQFTMENGLLTPTFKARRTVVEKKYNDTFHQLYQQLLN